MGFDESMAAGESTSLAVDQSHSLRSRAVVIYCWVESDIVQTGD